MFGMWIDVILLTIIFVWITGNLMKKYQFIGFLSFFVTILLGTGLIFYPVQHNYYDITNYELNRADTTYTNQVGTVTTTIKKDILKLSYILSENEIDYTGDWLFLNIDTLNYDFNNEYIVYSNDDIIGIMLQTTINLYGKIIVFTTYFKMKDGRYISITKDNILIEHDNDWGENGKR